MLPSELFYEYTHKTCVYNLNLISNISSIMKRGIVCHDNAQKLKDHESIAMVEVQDKRALVRVPNGLRLHSYANLYFDYHNPMLFKRKNEAERLCILGVDSRVLDLPNCVVSDRNAASDYVMFYDPSEGVQKLDFNTIYAQYWNSDDQIAQWIQKSIKCAEVLVPYRVPYDYIVKACVLDQEAKNRLIDAGFDKPVVVNRNVFFR